jgi:hypothetical protein
MAKVLNLWGTFYGIKLYATWQKQTIPHRDWAKTVTCGIEAALGFYHMVICTWKCRSNDDNDRNPEQEVSHNPPQGGSLSPVALALLTSQCCIDTVCNEFVVNLSWNAMNHIYFLSTSSYGDSLNLKCHHAFSGAVVLWVNMLRESSNHQQPVS